MTAAAQILEVDDRAHPERVTYALVALPVLFFVGLGIGVGVGVRDEDLTELVLALITTLVSLIPLVIDQARRPSERHVLLSTFSIVFIIGFVLPVPVLFMPGEGPIDAPSFGYSALLPVDIIRGQVATLIGLVCMLIGYAIPVAKMAPILPRFRRDWPPRAAVALAAVMIPFGLMIRAGGMLGLLPREIGTGILAVLSSSYLYGIALAAIVYLRHRSTIALAMLAIMVPFTSFLGVFTGGKSYMLYPWAMAVLASILVRRRIGLRWVVLGALATALVYPINNFVRYELLPGAGSAVGLMRHPGATLSKMSKFLSGSDKGEYFSAGLLSTVGRLDCIGAASVLIRDTPKVSPFQNGKTIGLFFVAFIPRAIWPDKPIITIGQFFTDVYGTGPQVEQGTSPTQLGEFFINFGYLGIIGGMLFYGLGLRTFHEMLLGDPITTPGLLVAVAVLFYLGTGFQSSIAAGWSTMVFSMLPVVLAHVLVTTLFPTPRVPYGLDATATAPRLS